MSQNKNISLQMKQVTKKFLGTTAVDQVDFEVRTGEVHALMGENGAGKSTLMKILAGSFTDYTGQVFINGKEVELHSPVAALDQGIGMIYQELSLALPISVAENLLAGRLPVKYGFILDKKEMIASAKACLEQVGLDIDPLSLISDISQHEAQLVEIAKVLWNKPSILVFDEPTSSLSREDASKLFEIIKQLKKAGLAIIYISHHLPEVFKIADRVTVLRDGKKIDTKPIEDVGPEDLVEMMIGQNLKEMYKESNRTLGDVFFRAENLSRYGFFHDISFSVKKGEILGIGGLSGSGRSELARVITGLDYIDSGKIFIQDKEIRLKSMSDALSKGIAYLTEDRKNEGLALRLSVMENGLSSLICENSKNFIYNDKEGVKVINQLIDELQIVMAHPGVMISSLSGGNQQKVLLAKWLATHPKLLILDEPTRGVDIGAKMIIHKTIEKLADQGIAVILISSDLPELVGLSNRIMIMRKGHFTKEMPHVDCTEESVLLSMNEQQSSQTMHVN